MDDYILREISSFEYFSGILNNKIETTEDLKDAMFLKSLDEAKKLLDFCNTFDEYCDFTICQIDLKEVD